MEQPRRSRDYIQTLSARDNRLRSLQAPRISSAPKLTKTETAEELLHGNEERFRIKKQRRSVWRQIRLPRLRTLVIGSAVFLVIILTVGGWLLFLRQSAPDANPFTAPVMASLKFPVYYPTKLPQGYRIDPKSVNIPQANVVVFDIVGPHGEKLYISEEARPDKFNLGGFYNSFSNLKEVGVSDGAVAVGYIDNGQEEVASRANNDTWILSNTKARIPLDQLTTMLKSLTVSY